MRIIELDGANWKAPLEFLEALYEGIEQGHPHGLGIDAFVDSMIWRGMGGVEPPYAIRIVNVGSAPKAVTDEIVATSLAIREARRERLSWDGVDVEVTISCPELSL